MEKWLKNVIKDLVKGMNVGFKNAKFRKVVDDSYVGMVCENYNVNLNKMKMGLVGRVMYF